MSEIRTHRKPHWYFNFDWIYNFNFREISYKKLIDEHIFFSKSGKKFFKIRHKKFLNLDILMEIIGSTTNQWEKEEIGFYIDESYNCIEYRATLQRLSFSCYEGEFSVHILDLDNADSQFSESTIKTITNKKIKELDLTNLNNSIDNVLREKILAIKEQSDNLKQTIDDRYSEYNDLVGKFMYAERVAREEIDEINRKLEERKDELEKKLTEEKLEIEEIENNLEDVLNKLQILIDLE